MKFRILQPFVCLFLIVSLESAAQTPIPELTLSPEFSLGITFPNFVGNKNGWHSKLYSAGAISIIMTKRLNQHWDAVSGIGISAYHLKNRSKTDDYLLDFTSPHFLAGIGYYRKPFARTQSFIKLLGGTQVGYKGIQKEFYEQYTVDIKGNGLFYFFLRPEIGIHQKARQKLTGSSFYTAFEVSAFFRFNFKSLGEVSITENQSITKLIPVGNIIGVNIRYVMPPGKKRLKEKAKTHKKRIRNIQDLN